MPRLTAEDRARRRLGIGSSDVPIILGLSPHESSLFAVFNEKIGLDEEGESDESEQMELGHDLEPFIAAWYERKTGAQLLPGGNLSHPEYPWAKASIDFRIQGRNGLLEIKNVGSFMTRAWDDTVDDGVPHHVRAQINWQAGIARCDFVDVATMLGGMKRRVFTVPFDAELFAISMVECGRFWRDHCATGTPPRLDGSKAAREYLEAKWPTKTTTVAPIDRSDMDAAAMAYFSAHDSLKNCGIEKEKATQAAILVCAEAGVDGIERLGSWRFTYLKTKTGKQIPRWTNLARGEEA